jgi:hypothetical protein
VTAVRFVLDGNFFWCGVGSIARSRGCVSVSDGVSHLLFMRTTTVHAATKATVDATTMQLMVLRVAAAAEWDNNGYLFHMPSLQLVAGHAHSRACGWSFGRACSGEQRCDGSMCH